MAAHEDRIRKHTPPEVNERINKETLNHIRQCAEDIRSINRRLDELEKEWDIERVLIAIAPIGIGAGLYLALKKDPKFSIFPGIILTFLLYQAIAGWAPPVAVMRRLGVRTDQEIERERRALMAIRGDFDDLKGKNGDAEALARAAWEAAED